MPPGVTPEANLLSVGKLESSGLSVIGFDLLNIGKLKLAVKDCLQLFCIIPDLKEGIGITLGKLDLLSETDNDGLLTELSINKEETFYRDLLSDYLGPESALLIVKRYELHGVGIDAVLYCLLYVLVELFKHNNLFSPAFCR